MENKSERVKSSETETESRQETFFRLKEEFDNADRNARNGIIIILIMMNFIKVSFKQNLTKFWGDKWSNLKKNWSKCERQWRNNVVKRRRTLK